MKKIALLFVLLALVVVAPLPARAASELKAAILLKTKKKLDVQLISRRSPDKESWIAVRIRDDEKVVEFAANEILYIKFEEGFDRVKLVNSFTAGKYRETARELKKFLSRTFPYMDIPNNIRPDVSWLLRCYYKASMWEDVRKTSRLVTRNLRTGPEREEAEVYNILALQEVDRYTDANRALAAMKPVARQSAVAPMYWFALVRKALAEKDWKTARTYADSIVSFAPKQLDWLPTGLYFSAKFHLVNGHYDVARQILDEMKVVDSRSRWTRMGRTLVEKDLDVWLTAGDASGSDRNGLYVGHPARGLNGATPVTGSCVQWDGDDDRLRLPVPLAGAFSIAFWLKTDGESVGLFTLTQGDREDGLNLFLKLGNAHVGRAGMKDLRTRGIGLSDDNWHHAVLVCDPGQPVALFLDGREVLRDGNHPGDLHYDMLTMGYAAAGAEPAFKGYLDDLQVYGRAIAEVDVAGMFNRGRGGPPANGLLAHLALDEKPFAAMLGQYEEPVPVEVEEDLGKQLVAVATKQEPKNETEEAESAEESEPTGAEETE